MSNTTDGIQAGSANTKDVRPLDKAQLNTVIKTKLVGKYTSPPTIASAINFFHTGKEENTRIVVAATDSTTTDFNALMNGWSTTLVYSLGMSWLELGNKAKHIQTGVFRVEDVRVWNMPTMMVQKRINFQYPYTDGPPKIICWLKCLDLESRFNLRIHAYAESIDEKGFTATIATWADSMLYDADMTWLAYPATQKGVASGRYAVTEMRSRWATDKPVVNGTASFGDAFKTTPNLIVGLTSLDLDHTTDCRIASTSSDVTPKGFNWMQGTWWGSLMYDAHTSWFAWTDEILTPPTPPQPPPQAIPSWVSDHTGHFSTQNHSGSTGANGANYANSGNPASNGNAGNSGSAGNSGNGVADPNNTNGNATKNVNDTTNITRNINDTSNITRNFSDGSNITRSVNDSDLLAKYTNNNSNYSRYGSERYGGDRYFSDRFYLDRDSGRYGDLDRSIIRYADLDRSSNRYSELIRNSYISPTRSDRTVTTISNTGRIPGLDASVGRLVSMDRVLSSEDIESSEEMDTSEIVEDSGTREYTSSERIVSYSST